MLGHLFDSRKENAKISEKNTHLHTNGGRIRLIVGNKSPIYAEINF